MDEKTKVLKEQAIRFRSVLEKYAKTDSDVEEFLTRLVPWFERIANGEIVPPCYDYQFAEFSNPDLSPLAQKYGFTDNELGQSEAEFFLAIRGITVKKE